MAADGTAPKRRARRVSARERKSVDAFRTISEVATLLDVEQHVLRFWESKFAQIKPLKRAGGRRYYRPEDVEMIRGIQHLLHDQGYTIKGVQKVLRESGPKHVLSIGKGLTAGDRAAPKIPASDEVKKVTPPPILSGQGRKVDVLQQQMNFGDISNEQKTTLSQVVMELESLKDYLNDVAAS